MLVPLQKFSATSQTLSLRHPDSATSDPLVAQRLWMAGSRPGQVALSGNHSVNKISVTLLCGTADLVLTAF